ncbi:hypothetical protein FOA43_002907 [Brettanomyces nanus]|uniref:Uncharacterized protein n=1 Tax=Eeniella nana TaxID=13502 RepID=A0A875S6C8_EENNA|nr:uncharacterized protein FOA43_002907 [Brettanomyces nanus]QPG75552.1 hypothetical protein FOA43_002907 [Brettanomyces nanus]
MNSSDDISLSTSKNWALPPRSKPKKGRKERPVTGTSRVKNKGTRVRINRQIHSNINLFTNNQSELQAQLQSVTRENGNLKKALAKLNREIESLKAIANSIEPNTSPFIVDASTNTLPLDPVTMNYIIDCKRLKREETKGPQGSGSLAIPVGLKPIVTGYSLKNTTFLSPKDILINPTALKPQTSIKAPKKHKKKREQENLTRDLKNDSKKDPKDSKKTPEDSKKTPEDSQKRLKSLSRAPENPQDTLPSLRKPVAPKASKSIDTPKQASKLQSASHPADLAAADWFSKNSFLDFDMYNDGMSDSTHPLSESPSSFMLESMKASESLDARKIDDTANGSTTTNNNNNDDALASPRFDFDNNDDLMY